MKREEVLKQERFGKGQEELRLRQEARHSLVPLRQQWAENMGQRTQDEAGDPSTGFKDETPNNTTLASLTQEAVPGCHVSLVNGWLLRRNVTCRQQDRTA